MKKENNIQIVCKLTEDMWLGLSDIRENLGHDDSLPYQANVFVMDRDNNPYGSTAFKRIAQIWNDGWGGESNLELVARTTQNIDCLKTLDELCKKHQFFYRGKPCGTMSLIDACDDMANIWIDIVGDKPKYKKSTLLYKFDDDPVVLAGKGNAFVLSEQLSV